MTLNMIRQVTSQKVLSPSITTILRKVSRVYTPDYLEAPLDKDKVHNYLYVQLEGFDFPVVEKYQSFVTKASRKMGLNIVKSFPLPHKELEVTRFKPNSDIVQSTYTIKLYQRILTFKDTEATKVGSWIRVLEATLPEGVQMHIDNCNEDYDQKRYIPNPELLEMKTLLQERFGEEHRG